MIRTRIRRHKPFGALIAVALAWSVVSTTAHVHGAQADSPITCAVCVASTATSRPSAPVQVPPPAESQVAEKAVPRAAPALAPAPSSVRARAPPTSHA